MTLPHSSSAKTMAIVAVKFVLPFLALVGVHSVLRGSPFGSSHGALESASIHPPTNRTPESEQIKKVRIATAKYRDLRYKGSSEYPARGGGKGSDDYSATRARGKGKGSSSSTEYPTASQPPSPAYYPNYKGKGKGTDRGYTSPRNKGKGSSGPRKGKGKGVSPPTTTTPSPSVSSIPSASPTESTVPTETGKTAQPTAAPTVQPTEMPSLVPSTRPSEETSTPTEQPSNMPSATDTQSPSASPSSPETDVPSASPSSPETDAPSASPSSPETDAPSASPSSTETDVPSASPSSETDAPTAPSQVPSEAPSTETAPPTRQCVSANLIWSGGEFAPVTTQTLDTTSPSTCANNKAFPGFLVDSKKFNVLFSPPISGSSPGFVNDSGGSQCARIIVDRDDCPAGAFVALAYVQNQFNPNNITNGYLGDSGALIETLTEFSFVLPGSTSYNLVLLTTSGGADFINCAPSATIRHDSVCVTNSGIFNLVNYVFNP